MRRRLAAADGPPGLLLRFNREDWPGRDDREAIGHWKAARAAFAEAHGWPGGTVDRLRGEFEERRRFYSERVEW